MSVADDLKKIQGRVKSLLNDSPELRDNDKLLWLAYISKHTNIPIIIKLGDMDSFKECIMDENTPMFESISRARRLVQAEYPELAGNKRKRLEIATEVKELLK